METIFSSLSTLPPPGVAWSRRARHALVALLLLAAPVTVDAQSVRYRLVPLTEISSAHTSCVPTAIHASGIVVGYCGAGEVDSFAVRWTADGAVANLGKLPGGTFTRAWGINALGQIAGDGDTDGNDLTSKALVLGGSGWIEIDGSGGSFQNAFGITDGGVVFGNYSSVGSPATETWDPVFWTYDQRHDRYDRNDLPKPPAAGFSGALLWAVNSVGAAVGQVASDVVGNRGGFWRNDAAHTLVVLDTPAGMGSSAAFGVSDDGRAVGRTYGVAGFEHAILWQNDVNRTPVDLGTLPGDQRSEAYGVNVLGQVVGASFGTTGRGFIYQNEVLTELTTLLDKPFAEWTVNEPAGINNAGSIIAVATLDGVRHPVLLVPFEVVKAAQTISFMLPAGPFRFGDMPFAVSATSTSGLPVTFAAGGACSVAGTTVTIVGAGICQVIASQDGDADWEPADDVPQSASISKADAAIDVTPYHVTFDGAPHIASAVATGVTGEDLSGAVFLEGTRHTNAGIYGTDAWTFTGGANYNDKNGTVANSIAPAAQVIAFGALEDRRYGDLAFSVSAAGGASGNAVTFTAAGNCAVAGALVTLTAAGSCTITASQAGNDNYLAAAPVSRSFTIAPALPAETPLVNPGPQTSKEGERVELRLVDRRVRGKFSASNLPGKLRINNRGTIRGHVEKDAADPSPYEVIITYTAPDGVSSSVAFSWTILRHDPRRRSDRDDRR